MDTLSPNTFIKDINVTIGFYRKLGFQFSRESLFRQNIFLSTYGMLKFHFRDGVTS